MISERIRAALSYDPPTGDLIWKAKISRKVVLGARAGCVNRAGYLVVGVGGKLYYAHQIAWLLMTGEWVGRIDHRDGDRLNNRWANLRQATAQQNALNARRAASNSSGFKGVSWHRGAGKWSAYITLDGEKRHLGLHDRPEDAHAAYLFAASQAQPDFVRAS